MGTFAVLLHEDELARSAELRDRIENRYPGSGRSPGSGHYKLSDHVYLVSGPRLISEVNDALGFGDDQELCAAIFRLNDSFSGRSYTSLWNWLRGGFRRCLLGCLSQ